MITGRTTEAALLKAGDSVDGQFYLQAAREHDTLLKLLERASSGAGRYDLNLLKALGEGYERVGLIPQAKAWYRLAVARDPADAGVQSALYRLGAATPRPNQTPSGPQALVRPSGNDGQAVRRDNVRIVETSAPAHPGG